MYGIRSEDVLDVVAVTAWDETSVAFVVTGWLPFKVKLINLLCVFSADQLANELELFSEFEDGLLKDGYFSGGPILEDWLWSHGIDHNIEVFLFIEVIDGIEVELDWFFLLLGIGLVDVCLGGD